MRPALLRSADVARLAGISPDLLWKWRRAKTPEGQRLRACIYKQTARSTWWLSARLVAAGIIPAEQPVAAEPQADVAATFTASTSWGYR